jgi:probable phosphoglycerate mutase
LRHAPTDWNERKLIQGRRDVPLSVLGKAAASTWRVPQELLPARWLTSPLRRARETAALMGAVSARNDQRLIEMDWGAWEGRTLLELRETLGESFAEQERRGLHMRPPAGESPHHVMFRVQPLLAELAESSTSAVLVTHKGVIRAAIAIATGWGMMDKPPLRIGPGQALLLEPRIDQDGWSAGVVSLGE